MNLSAPFLIQFFQDQMKQVLKTYASPHCLFSSGAHGKNNEWVRVCLKGGGEGRGFVANRCHSPTHRPPEEPTNQPTNKPTNDLTNPNPTEPPILSASISIHHNHQALPYADYVFANESEAAAYGELKVKHDEKGVKTGGWGVLLALFTSQNRGGTFLLVLF
jgi:hypothetical protein